MNGHNAHVPQRPKRQRLRAVIPLLALVFSCLLAGTAFADSQKGDNLRTMSGEDKIQMASKARRGLAESAARIEAMRDEAILANEGAAQIQCLNEAVSSVNGFLSVTKNSYESLQVAVSAQDDRTANHHLMMVSTSAQRASSIEAKASQCVGNALRYVGDAQTVQTVDPRLADFDPTNYYDDDSGGPFIFLEELPPKATAER